MRRRAVLVVLGVVLALAGSSMTVVALPPLVTLSQLRELFPGKVGNAAVVSVGLPNLNKQMRAADITTPARKAAFLTTLAYESTFLYNIRQHGDDRKYGGRGYIQLTGAYNYQAAGDHLGVNLMRHPEKARSLKWSAAIASWYWTVARDVNPIADDLDMGRVNAAIGYPPGPHDAMRCDAFKSALKLYLGTVPKGVKCRRPQPSTAEELLRAGAPEQPHEIRCADQRREQPSGDLCR